MTSKVFQIGIYLLLTVIVAGAAFGNGTTPAPVKETEMVLAGTVTARDGSTLTLRTDDGKLYTVDAGAAVIILDRLPAGCISLRVGDRVQVYGTETSLSHITASRLHLFVSETTTMPPALGAGPGAVDDTRIPAVGDALGAWRNRGLVTSVQYGSRTITIATSSGPFTIDASTATVIASNNSVSLVRVSEGDAVRIWGDIVGLNRIKADRIELLRGKSAQDSAVSVKTTSVVGKINYIDYPSFTLRINTREGDVNVMVDEGTFIHFQSDRKAFMDLGIGQVVKVYGIGNLASGFAATQIQIVGDPGR